MKCSTVNCDAEATCTVFWPGKEGNFCDACTSRARTIASVMGFSVATRPLPLREPTDEELDAVLEQLADREESEKLDRDDRELARALVGDHSKRGES